MWFDQHEMTVLIERERYVVATGKEWCCKLSAPQRYDYAKYRNFDIFNLFFLAYLKRGDAWKWLLRSGIIFSGPGVLQFAFLEASAVVWAPSQQNSSPGVRSPCRFKMKTEKKTQKCMENMFLRPKIEKIEKSVFLPFFLRRRPGMLGTHRNRFPRV